LSVRDRSLASSGGKMCEESVIWRAKKKKKTTNKTRPNDKKQDMATLKKDYD